MLTPHLGLSDPKRSWLFGPPPRLPQRALICHPQEGALFGAQRRAPGLTLPPFLCPYPQDGPYSHAQHGATTITGRAAGTARLSLGSLAFPTCTRAHSHIINTGPGVDPHPVPSEVPCV